MVTLPRTQSASPGGERPGTGQLRVAHHLRETDGPGPRAPPSPSRSTLPCGDLGPPPGPAHQTPEKDPVLRWLGQPLHPRASRLPLVHASEDVWGWPAHSPLWTAGVREGVARNPVDWGAGAGAGAGPSQHLAQGLPAGPLALSDVLRPGRPLAEHTPLCCIVSFDVYCFACSSPKREPPAQLSPPPPASPFRSSFYEHSKKRFLLWLLPVQTLPPSRLDPRPPHWPPPNPGAM